MPTTQQHPIPRWAGRRVTQLRATWTPRIAQAQALGQPLPCGKCKNPILTTHQWIIGHIKSRHAYPELTWDLTNHWPEHKTCSDKSANDAKREAKTRFLSSASTRGESPLSVSLPSHPADVDGASEPGVSRPEDFAGCAWMVDLLVVPENASWPRFMSPPHPDAVCSFAWEGCRHAPADVTFEAWSLAEHGVTLRWWQRLAFRRQLEHDADGRLVWRIIVESGPRRIGKSVRLRLGALWRLAVGPSLFPERQLVVHTGMDLAVVREIHELGWEWAEAKWGARAVTRGNGKERIKTPSGDRWLAKAPSSSGYGADLTLGMVDEAWAVAPVVVDEGLEPASMERISSQIALTSTAHRKATSLMRRRIRTAIAGLGEDWTTLLLLWCAARTDEVGDVRVWRSASPHWSADRESLMQNRYDRAMRGEADPEAHDPDPMEGFKAQYLNIWPLSASQEAGEQAVKDGAWGSLKADLADDLAPAVVAVESWFAQGASVAVCSPRPDGGVGVRVRTFPSVAAAAVWVDSLQWGELLVGKSLAKDPQFEHATAVSSTARQAMLDLRRLVDDREFVHDVDTETARQVLALRVLPGFDGPRLVSRDRVDGVKALVWGVTRARTAAAPFVLR